MDRLKNVAAVLLLASLAACGFNDVIAADENVKGAWAEVQNQYKRRADLVPSLVNTVKGTANFETETLTKVTEARAKAVSLNADSSTLDSPEKLHQFEAAQQNLGNVMSRVMVVVEKYPDLKASASFRDLQTQLEGTENRITVARNRFIAAVRDYNVLVQTFPSMIGAAMRSKTVRPTFEGTAGAENPPEVKF